MNFIPVLKLPGRPAFLFLWLFQPLLWGAGAGLLEREDCFVQDSVLSSGAAVPYTYWKEYGANGRLDIYHNGVPLLEGRDFRADPEKEKIELAFAPAAGDTLCARYRMSPVTGPHSFTLYRLESIPVLTADAASGIGMARPLSAPVSEDAGPQYRLDYGGDKSLLVTVGGEGGMSLEQSLRLDVKGQLAENIYIAGHLSDQQVPIQPEGNTATLKEVDRIFVQVYGRQYSYTLGDYMLDFGEPGVDRYVSSVQGMKGEYNQGPYRGELTFSRSRGQYHTYAFGGEFGRQTGYFIRGKDGQSFVTALAGTEKLWRNGERLERGKHYQIEYGEGRIDFLKGLVVSGEDLFTVEFQYTEFDYPAYLYSADAGDSAGSFTWSARVISERQARDNPEAFSLSEGDAAVLAAAGDALDGVRLPGAGDPFGEPGWEADLYFQSGGIYVYADSLAFDSLRAAGEALYLMVFSPSDTGRYRQEAGRFVYDPAGGGFAPGRTVSLPVSRTHSVIGAGYRAGGPGGPEHASAFRLMGSHLDRNLFSNLDDSDNAGFGAAYDGSQAFGRPLDGEGLGRWTLMYNGLYKNGDYTSFRQLIEEYAFREEWNLPAAIGEKDFISSRITLQDELFTGVTVGGLYGKAEGGVSGRDPRHAAESDKIRAFTRAGEGEKNFSALAESKIASVSEPGRNRDQDNYRTDLRAGYAVSALLPYAGASRDEWITRPEGESLSRSRKDKWNTGFRTRPLWAKLKTGSELSVLDWESNFLGAAPAYADSVHSWQVSQTWELFDLGPWGTDLFLSYQNFRVREDPLSTPAENDARLAEWNSRFQDPGSGYIFNSFYRINQTSEIPLIEYYRKVPSGKGDYRCPDTSSGLEAASGPCVDDETGDWTFWGMIRDTTRSAVRLQELDWNGNVSLSPERFPLEVQGVLADLTFNFQYAFSHKDTTSAPGLLPLFTDAQVREQLGGRARYLPSVRWTAPSETRTCQLTFERDFNKQYGYLAGEELQVKEDIQYREELTDRLAGTLTQNAALRKKSTTGVSSDLRTVVRGGGAGLEQRIMNTWLLRPSADYAWTVGRENGADMRLHSLYPRLRLEKEFVTGGRAFGEYGLNTLWGRGAPGMYTRVNGFDRGVTHRFQAGVDFRMGEYIYGSGSYLLRKEPDDSSLFQKLTAEVRAVF